MIKFIDLFSGIGGFRLGLERTGHYEHVWSNDINEYANKIYTERFGEEGHYSGDIRGVDAREIPYHELLCGGFPCQAFSVAGKRKGFEDTRGTLFFEICRIIEAKRPKLLLLENVKGLLNHDGGRTFTVILQSLDELGYWVEWQVLNSKYFGVPQNRERVFIVGHLRGRGGREVFPITGTNGETVDERELKFLGGIDSPSVKKWVEDGNEYSRNFPQGQRVYDSDGLSSTLNSQGGGLGAKTGLYTVKETGKNSQSRRVYDPDGLSPTLSAGKRENSTGQAYSHNIIRPVLTPDRLEKRQNGRRFKENGDPSFTLTSPDRHGVMTNNQRIRRLTPTECERLQGFPDGWTEGISDTQRYSCLGNAVTVNVIEFLGKIIVEAEQ